MNTEPPLPASPDGREPASEARRPWHPLLGWYAGLLAGILPVLLLGFLYSALADRLEFVGWALLVAAIYAAALRQGLQASWPAARLSGALMLLLAAGLGVLTWLVGTYHEVLELGLNAMLPERAAVSVRAADPRCAAAVAAVFSAVGAALLGGGSIARRKHALRHETMKP